METFENGISGSIIDYSAETMRVLGPPGSGKTSLIIERFKSLKKRGINSLIITYSNQSRDHLLSGIIPQSSSWWGERPVYTYAALAREIIPKPFKLVADMEEQILIDKVIGQNKTKLKSIYKSMCWTDKFMRSAKDVFHILEQNGIDKENIKVLRTSTGASDKLRDILLLYERFLQELEKHKLSTFYGISWRAAEVLLKRRAQNPFADIEVFLVEDFEDIDTGQFHLLHSLVPPNGKAVLNVFGDPTGARFSYRGTQHHFLVNIFPELYDGKTFYLKAGVPRPAGLAVSVTKLLKETLGEEAKSYLPVLGENNDEYRNLAGFLGSSGRKDKKKRSPSNESEVINSFDAKYKPQNASSNDLINRDASSTKVRVFTTKDEFEEASLVASSIRRLVEQGDYKPEEIAVTTRDKQRYEAVIAMACRQHGIPLQTGRPERSAFRNLIISLIGFLRNTEDEISLNALLTSSLRDHLEAVLQSLIGSEVIVDDGEGEKDRGRGGLLQNLNAGVRTGDDSQGKGKKEAAMLPELLKAFAQNMKKLDPGDWMNEVSEKLILPVARKAAPRTNGLSLEILAIEFKRDWDNYNGASARFKAKGGVASYLKLSPFFADTAGPMASTRGRVGFYSCHEMSNRFFPVVFLMGCSETVFPELERKDEFFPYEELEKALTKTASSGSGAEAGRKKVDLRTHISLIQNITPEECLRNEYGLLLHALTRATEKLTITAPEMLGDEQYPAPSDIIRSTFGGKRLDEASGAIAPPFLSLAKAVTGEAGEAGSEAAARYAARDSAQPAAAIAKIDPRITTLVPLVGLWPHEPRERKAFSIDRFSLSSSALDLYTRCNRLFFYRRVLRVPERELIYYKPGNLFHIMLEKLCSKYRTHDAILSPRAGTEITKIIDKVIAEDSDISTGTFYESLLQKQLGELAGAFFALEEAREGTYTIKELESRFEFSYDAWNFKGYMDRIDRIEGEKDFLIDYKTGTREVRTGETLRKRVVEEDTFSKNKNWQVPLYVWAQYDRRHAFPYAYSHYLTPMDKEPKMVSVFILKNEREWEALSASLGKKSAASSYLLESEVEECMREASTVAKAIFAPHEYFERTDDKGGTCRMCPFKRTCLGNADGSE